MDERALSERREGDRIGSEGDGVEGNEEEAVRMRVERWKEKS